MVCLKREVSWAALKRCCHDILGLCHTQNRESLVYRVKQVVKEFPRREACAGDQSADGTTVVRRGHSTR